MNKNKELWKLVSENDRKIYDLAAYFESKGFMIAPDPEKVLNRFAELKNRVLRSGISMERLEVDILTKFGVTEGSQYISAPEEALPEDIKKMIKDLSIEAE